MTCICCPIGCDLEIEQISDSYKVTGNKCPRGEKYAIEEMTAPKRVVTSTVAIEGSLYPVIPVKTEKAIPKEKIFDVMKVLSNVKLQAPIKVGDVVVSNIADTGVDVVVTKNS